MADDDDWDDLDDWVDLDADDDAASELPGSPTSPVMGESDDAIEEPEATRDPAAWAHLESIHEQYMAAYEAYHRLKEAERDAIVAALRVGHSPSAILELTAHNIFELEKYVGDEVLPLETHHELDHLRMVRESEAAKRRLRRKGKPRNEREIEWRRLYEEYVAATKRRRISRLKYGDEWWAADITEDEYEALKSRLDAPLT